MLAKKRVFTKTLCVFCAVLLLLSSASCNLTAAVEDESLIASIELSADRVYLDANGRDTAVFKVSALDKDGNFLGYVDAEIYWAEDMTLYEGTKFSTEEKGSYLFRAKYNDLNSNRLCVSAGLSSNLPVITITTDGGKPNSAVLVGSTTSVFNNFSNKDEVLKGNPDFTVRTMLKIRGAGSQDFEKKQYLIKMVNSDNEEIKLPFLGMPQGTDWVLNGPIMDKSLIRNYIVFTVAGDIMEWAPRVRLCEVYMSTDWTTGAVKEEDYLGVYVAIEKIKRGRERVNIAKADPNEADIGFIFKRDKIQTGDETFWTMADAWLPISYVYPTQENITDEQDAFLQNYIREFETALYSDNFTDPETGYRKYIDWESFADYIIIGEFFKNVDQGKISTYFYKDAGGKIKAGPIWDNNLTMGNVDYDNCFNPEGWHVFTTATWFNRLFQDPAFVELVAERYHELRKGVLSDENIIGLIDDAVETLGDAADRNFQKWYYVFHQYVWPNPEPRTTSHLHEIVKMKSFMLKRGAWMDENIDSFVIENPEGFIVDRNALE